MDAKYVYDTDVVNVVLIRRMARGVLRESYGPNTTH